MEKRSIINVKLTLRSALIFGLLFGSLPAVAQQNSVDTILYGSGGDLEMFICNSLGSIGLGCGSPPNVNVYNSSPNSAKNNFSPQNTDGNNRQQGQNNFLSASITNALVRRTVSDDEVILVKTPASISSNFLDFYGVAANGIKPTLGLTTDEAIFEIIKGQRHFIPTVDVFFDYGFDFNSVQNITKQELDKFPRAKLVKVASNGKQVYYITEGFMIRLIPNQRAFDSYGDREEDIITISKKEFNFYPRNQFVFVETPLTRDIFQVAENGAKRYIVPQALKRMGVTFNQVAPINKIQFDAYSYGAPIIY